MQESDFGMKDVVLRIVASNSDPEAREMEIKKMGKAYKEIAEGIMPKLRKSDYTFNAEKIGRSDEEISRLAKSNPDSLNVEEILYAGTLTQDNNEKLAIYTAAERIYPQDWRASNNRSIRPTYFGPIRTSVGRLEERDAGSVCLACAPSDAR